MNRNQLWSIVGVVLISSTILFFQNCGFKASISDLNSMSSEVLKDPVNAGSSNPPETADAHFVFDAGGLQNIYQSESLDLQIEFQANSQLKDVQISSRDGSAQMGVDYVFIQKTLTTEEIQNKRFAITVQTLYREVNLQEKDFFLIFNVTSAKDEVLNVQKRVVIKPRYEQLKFAKIKGNSMTVCGLESTGDIYCWGAGAGSRRFFDTDAQPVRIIPSIGSQIDFESFQFSESYFCFQQRVSAKVYCSNKLTVDLVEKVLRVVETNFSLSESQVQWKAGASNYIHYLESTGVPASELRLKSMYIGTTTVSSTAPVGIDYKNVYANNNSGFVYASDSQGRFYRVDTFSSQASTTQMQVGFNGNDVVETFSSTALLKNGNLVELAPYGATQSSDISMPELSVKSVGSSCVESVSRKIYCKPFSPAMPAFYDLTLKNEKAFMIKEFNLSNGSYSSCALDDSGKVLCRENDLRIMYSFNFVNSFWDPVPVEKSWIDSKLQSVMSYNPLDVNYSGFQQPECNLINYGLISCYNVARKVFGNQRLNYNSVRTYKTTAGINVNNFMSGSSPSGQWYSYGILPLQTREWYPVYRRALAIQSIPLNGSTPSCADDYFERDGKCYLKNPLNVRITQPSRVVNFPNRQNREFQFEITLDRPLESDLVLNIGQFENGCLGENKLSTSCFPDLFQACFDSSCANSEYSFGWANSRWGAQFGRYDWDYTLDMGRIIFFKGDTRKILTMRLSMDERYNVSKVLNLKLSGLIDDSNLIVSNSIQVLFRRQQNPQVPANEMSYSKLMGNNGVLMRNCLECHNSAKRDGGFDIADYEDLLVARGVAPNQNYLLAPGQDRVEYDVNFNKNITAVSQIYRRLLPQFTPESLLMPRNKILNSSEIEDIENWLTRGAKNN